MSAMFEQRTDNTKQNFSHKNKDLRKVQKKPPFSKERGLKASSILPVTARHVSGPLFDPKQLMPAWKSPRRVGSGLLNGMNTCFLNSVLQCLTYTPPLAQYMLAERHRAKCSIPSYCALCAMEVHVLRSFASSKGAGRASAFLPKYFTFNLKFLSKTMRLGQQEDANEFLMFLFAAFQKSSTYGLGKLEPKVEESTLIHQIFGGRMQSQLRCNSCKATSNNYEAFLDLSLDLHKADSLKKALQNFIKVDVIGGSEIENRYLCGSCKRRVIAGKQMTLCQLPMMLNIHLKRFTFDMQRGYMRKVASSISYPEILDMAPYVSKDIGGQRAIYRLYAVLVHLGSGCSSGHYYAFVKSPEGKWYRMDDEDVTQVSLDEVLSQKAYMLFYADTGAESVKQSAHTTTSNEKPAAVNSDPIIKTKGLDDKVMMPSVDKTTEVPSERKRKASCLEDTKGVDRAVTVDQNKHHKTDTPIQERQVEMTAEELKKAKNKERKMRKKERMRERKAAKAAEQTSVEANHVSKVTPMAGTPILHNLPFGHPTPFTNKQEKAPMELNRPVPVPKKSISVEHTRSVPVPKKSRSTPAKQSDTMAKDIAPAKSDHPNAWRVNSVSATNSSSHDPSATDITPLDTTPRSQSKASRTISKIHSSWKVLDRD
ncbi:hypothetical protein BDF14DRAFT_1881423 [Spinellus fusiger]|nr:hypothetical protein BDF14DRAFT_1881423 [Spinellus fusiger]